MTPLPRRRPEGREIGALTPLAQIERHTVVRVQCPALLAFDAAVWIRGAHGERFMDLEDFMQRPTEERRSETLLAPDELGLGLRLPPHPEPTRSVYLKVMDRKRVAPIPWRVPAAGRVLLGREAPRRGSQPRPRRPCRMPCLCGIMGTRCH